MFLAGFKALFGETVFFFSLARLPSAGDVVVVAFASVSLPEKLALYFLDGLWIAILVFIEPVLSCSWAIVSFRRKKRRKGRK
uniref:Uncharacterized protein n=1 Tax=Kalanchoe fedtschenkoi TaxID=63787 RepID=A0A7N0RIF7_KALFE